MTRLRRRLLRFVSAATMMGLPTAAAVADPLMTLSGTRSVALSGAADLGLVPDATTIESTRLILKRSAAAQAAFDRLTQAQQDPSSPLYHRWFTAAEIGSEFGPSTRDLATISDWLRANGLTVGTLAPTRLSIAFSGTATAIGAAFGAPVHAYRLRSGRQVAALAADPRLPATLSGIVAGVTGVDGNRPEPLFKQVGPVVRSPDGRWHPAGGVAGAPVFAGGGGQQDVAPADFATIYDATPLRTGSTVLGNNQTIAVVEDSSFLTSDWRTFRSVFGLAGYTGGSVTIVHPGCTLAGRTPDEPETALDAEWASAIAPNAAIQVAACSDASGGIQASLQGLVDEAAPPRVISVSFGECEAQLGASAANAWASLLQQGAAEGISIFVSTGDSGSAGCDQNAAIASKGISVNGLASSQYDVAVGGTDFADYVSNTIATYWSTANTSAGGSAKSYIPELPWNDTCANPALAGSQGTLAFCNNASPTSGGEAFLATGGSGGGQSRLFAKPAYQSGVYGIPNDGVRDLPDVVLFASNGIFDHALLYCMSDAAQGGQPCSYGAASSLQANSAGGTSFAAPSFAGIQALIDQKKGAAQGNPNPRLYAMSITQGNTLGGACWSARGISQPGSCVFHDIASGGIDQACSSGSPGCYSAGHAYGVLSTSTTSQNDAFGADWGYDLATGLGSVDVTNLVNNF